LRSFWVAAWAVTAPLFAAVPSVQDTLAPVVVRAERPAGTSALTASEFNGALVPLDARGESSLVRVLSRRAGVFVQRAGGDDGHAVIQLRGQDPVQTRFFLEGIPLTDAQTHSSQVGWFPAEAFESVDLFPEGSPAAWGADGLGGAIALHLPEAGLSRSFLGSRIGAFGARRIFGRVAGRSPVGYSLFIDAAQAQEDFVYRDNGGTPLVSDDDSWAKRDHNAQRWASVLPQVQLWKNNSSQAQLLSFHTFRENEIPGAVGLPLQGQLQTQFHLVGARVSQKGAGPLWDFTTYGWATDQRFSAASELSALQIRSSFCTAWGARAKVGEELSTLGWEASLGANFDGARLSTSQSEIVADRVVLPLGASARWNLTERWSIKPALLAQTFIYGGAGRRQSFSFSPRLGVEWLAAAGQRWRISGGHFHRSPTLGEMYGVPSTVAANPGLVDEQAWKAEAGWDARWASVGPWSEVQMSATVSAAFARNLIVLVPNSQLSFVALNVGRSRILTSELALEGTLGRDWSLRANGALLSTQNQSESAAYQDKDLPMRPTFRGGLEAQWSQGPWRLTYSLQATGSLFADPANTKRIGEYWEHGVWGSWQPRGWGTWMVELRNITDATTVGGQDWNFNLAQNTTGLAGFPSPGRRVYVTWRYDI
jgi:iron complex outermembrane recepter protein